MRLTRTSAVFSVLYVALGLVWAFGARPPGPTAIYAAWFVAVALIGAFIPGIANQVSIAMIVSLFRWEINAHNRA